MSIMKTCTEQGRPGIEASYMLHCCLHGPRPNVDCVVSVVFEGVKEEEANSAEDPQYNAVDDPGWAGGGGGGGCTENIHVFK